MTPIANAVGWFEIPVTDMERATKFYETVFETTLRYMPLGELEMAMFPPHESNKGAQGALVKHEKYYKPSQDGVLIYFTAQSGDLKKEVSRVEAAGGKILAPIKQISEDYGWMAVCLDTEGNRFAIHSRN
ncbi:MAG TPA: VOC family protein [Candidatus Baltobacteraceae bacterium]|nr:VOC family protein [Candidatus Baltobacteraceae bacterium]